MKRIDLIRHLEQHGCTFDREGAKHTVYVNRAKRKSSTIPRGCASSGFDPSRKVAVAAIR
jgi:hypothetical protein